MGEGWEGVTATATQNKHEEGFHRTGTLGRITPTLTRPHRGGGNR